MVFGELVVGILLFDFRHLGGHLLAGSRRLVMEQGVGRPGGKVGSLLRLVVLEEHLVDVVADVVLMGRQGKGLVDVDLRRVGAV